MFSNSVIHTHVSIVFQNLFPFRVLQSIEQSSLCYTVGPCWLSILNTAVCANQSQTQERILDILLVCKLLSLFLYYWLLEPLYLSSGF